MQGTDQRGCIDGKYSIFYSFGRLGQHLVWSPRRTARVPQVGWSALEIVYRWNTLRCSIFSVSIHLSLDSASRSSTTIGVASSSVMSSLSNVSSTLLSPPSVMQPHVACLSQPRSPSSPAKRSRLAPLMSPHAPPVASWNANRVWTRRPFFRRKKSHRNICSHCMLHSMDFSVVLTNMLFLSCEY